MHYDRARAAALAAVWSVMTCGGCTAARASGFDVGGFMGGIGGIVQGAAQLQMQREQMQQQLEFQKQLLRQQQQQLQAPGPYASPSPTVTPTEANPPASPAPTRNFVGEAFQVDNHVLGSTLSYGELTDLKCQDSEQFIGFEWCRGSRKSNGVESGIAVLRAAAGDIQYYSKFYPSAFFKTGAVRGQIDEISTRHHMSPHFETMPATEHGDGGVIATWGQVRLIRLNAEALKTLSSTVEVHEGVLVDFLSNARVSARRGLPVFRLSGGPGYYWAAQWDRAGKGILRFGIVNTAAWEPQGSAAPAGDVATRDATGTRAPTPEKANTPAKPDISSASTSLPETRTNPTPTPGNAPAQQAIETGALYPA